MITFAEREQLELVAKAVGASLDDQTGCWMIQHADNVWRDWAPFTSFRDAMDVAFRMGLRVDFSGASVSHWRLKDAMCITVYGGRNPEHFCGIVMHVAAQVAKLPPQPEPKPFTWHDFVELRSKIEALVEDERQNRLGGAA